ncbi:MAG: type II secretion system protein GspJ [Phycisphaerales bacterium]
MNSKTGKHNLTELKVIRPDRSAAGFTLVEILVAVAIIATIVSMVYGSYFATAKSTEAYKAKMTVSSQTRKVLTQMARQIRCSYISKEKKLSSSDKTDTQSKIKLNDKTIKYFHCEPDIHGNKTLHLVTTNRLYCQETQKEGLFDIIYKFDKYNGILYLSQKRLAGSSEELKDERNYRPILESIERLELEFFDGNQWLSEWRFEQKKELPSAVKISIICKDENNRQCHYSIVSYIGCSGNQKRNISFERLMAINK